MRKNISNRSVPPPAAAYCAAVALKLALPINLLMALTTAPAADSKLTGDAIPAQEGELIIHPINHATFALGWKDKLVLIDPVGGGKRFEALPPPDLILVTDIHGDHLNADTLAAVAADKTAIVAPAAVAEKLPEKLRKQTTVLAN